MSSSGLLEHINYEKAYRINRLEAANWVLAHPETLPELVAYCFGKDKKIATKAAWVLEFVCRSKLSLLFPHLNTFIIQLPKAEGHGALRAVSLICELLMLDYYKNKNAKLQAILTSQHKTIITECCFDWMITNQKVACQARAMLALYLLGTEIDWIHPELQAILNQNIVKGSAGYKSRGGKILEKIHRFKQP
ncbi:adenylosuccinate lyase [Jejudonia soesokkakensis]|uniref:Adenylosuccinate lyase n=1 Tax=Jejudonia soesokkakensis TaxID=1323432 RepID=A0ABW2MXR9_9FLAO